MTRKKRKKPPLGTGERFRRLVKKLKKRGARSPKALAAWIGARKYGRKKMTAMAVAGRKRKRKAKRKK
jgi:hypothetical protein